MVTVLVFVPDDFDEVFLKKMLIPLSQSNVVRMYIINRPVDLVVDVLKGFKRLRKYFSNVKDTNGTIKIIFPFVLLNEAIHESIFSRGNINMKILIWQVKRLIKREGIRPEELVLWCFHPFHYKVMQEIPAKSRIYEVYDEYCYNHEDELQRSTHNAEKEMVLLSDEIICSSEKLFEKFQGIVTGEKGIHLISTCADDRSFAECRVKQCLSWDEIPGPRLLILGAIRRQTNVSLIRKLAAETPRASIVFIGKVLTGRYKNHDFKSLLEDCNNVYHIELKSHVGQDYENIKYCLRSADIGLYPASKCYYSTYANPNRIYEYTSAGLPIVASNINRESDFPVSIVVVDNDNDFVSAVHEMLVNGTTERERDGLRKFAKKHSASENVKKYIRILQSTITSKNTG